MSRRPAELCCISRPLQQSCQHEGRSSYRRDAPRDWLIASKGVQTLEGVAQVWWRLLPDARTDAAAI